MGVANFEKGGQAGAPAGKIFAARGSDYLCVKGLCGKEAISADSVFGHFCRDKSD